MKVAVLMMQKDEYRLLEPWILHHAELLALKIYTSTITGQQMSDALTF